jgi:hypothetical protein
VAVNLYAKSIFGEDQVLSCRIRHDE